MSFCSFFFWEFMIFFLATSFPCFDFYSCFFFSLTIPIFYTASFPLPFLFASFPILFIFPFPPLPSVFFFPPSIEVLSPPFPFADKFIFFFGLTFSPLPIFPFISLFFFPDLFLSIFPPFLFISFSSIFPMTFVCAYLFFGPSCHYLNQTFPSFSFSPLT